MRGNHEAEVDERQAAVLIGLPIRELRLLAQQAAVGHHGEHDQELIFTYDDLRQLCLLVARSNL